MVAALATAFAPAAGTAMAVPRPVGPDHAVLVLVAEAQRLQGAVSAAEVRLDGCLSVYEEMAPERPEVLFHRLEDHVGHFNLPMGPHCDRLNIEPRLSSPWTAAEIAMLPFAPPPIDPGLQQEQQSRVDELSAEYARWTAQCKAARHSAGVLEAERAVAVAHAAQLDLVERACAARAITSEGLAARAGLIDIIGERLDGDEENLRNLLVRSTLRDLSTVAQKA